MQNDSIERLAQAILTHSPAEGWAMTAVNGVAVTRFSQPQGVTGCFYQPLAALVVQGKKRSMIGGIPADYGPGELAVVSLSLPGAYQIEEASPEEPFLSVSLRLDRQLIADILSKMPEQERISHTDNPAVMTAAASEDVINTFTRVLDLLDTPDRLEVFAPMLVRELTFYLLQGPYGACLRRFCGSDAAGDRITKSVEWLRSNFREPLKVEQLASQVFLSPSTFHRRFKKATGLSPIQFQKSLRLFEAERLMLSEGMTASAAAIEVGYESVSQFSREYRRHFGAPPKQDIEKKRALAGL